MRKTYAEQRSGAVLSKLWNTLNNLSSKKPLKYTLYLSAIIIFFALILIPPIIGILTKAGSLQNVFNDPALMNTALGAIATSFIIGLVVAALGLVGWCSVGLVYYPRKIKVVNGTRYFG